MHENHNGGESDTEEYKAYLDERRELEEKRFKVGESLDKGLITLSAGALAISMTFIKDVVKQPVWPYLLVGVWVLLGSSP